MDIVSKSERVIQSFGHRFKEDGNGEITEVEASDGHILKIGDEVSGYKITGFDPYTDSVLIDGSDYSVEDIVSQITGEKYNDEISEEEREANRSKTKTAEKKKYKDLDEMTFEEKQTEMKSLQKEISKKYGNNLKSFTEKLEEAQYLYQTGSEYEDKKGTEYAQKHYYDEADKIRESLPEEIVRLWDLEEELH